MGTVFGATSDWCDSVGIRPNCQLNSGILFLVDPEELDSSSEMRVDAAVVTVMALIAELDLYSLQIMAYPWKFALVPSSTEEVRRAFVSEAVSEWQVILRTESEHVGWLSTAAPHTTYQWYRELMSVGSPFFEVSGVNHSTRQLT
jgi:hypothetical protein